MGGVMGSMLLGVVVTACYTALHGQLVGVPLDTLGWRYYVVVVLLGGFGSLLGIVGDLFASVIKRQCGIKDYGTIFPGHGGIMDRFDSVLFIAPFVAMVVTAVFLLFYEITRRDIMTKKVTVLGSTGSIGTQSLDVIRAQEYSVFGLAAHSNVELLLRQVQEFHPHCIAVVDDAAADRAARELHGMPGAPVLLRGKEGLEELAAMDGSDIVLNAVVGIAGLAATLSAIKSGRDVALANKESLVTGGSLVTDAVRENNVKLLPVDSEHSAIFQCLQDEYSAKSLQKILLTASGGPFFGRTRQELQNVTKDDALRHPNWSMGSKITIDSATLMNKGLELIEAVWLFGLPAEQVQVVVQRQSIIHSMVQFSDNSILAQLGVPDMRIPIQYALTWPERVPGPAPELDFTKLHELTF